MLNKWLKNGSFFWKRETVFKISLLHFLSNFVCRDKITRFSENIIKNIMRMFYILIYKNIKSKIISKWITNINLWKYVNIILFRKFFWYNYIYSNALMLKNIRKLEKKKFCWTFYLYWKKILIWLRYTLF